MATTTSDLTAVADALREHERFLVTTHENPDGDALGSLLATTLALRQLGKDAAMYLGGQAPLPGEYAFMDLAELLRDLPEDASERVLVAVDCANESRLGPDPEVLASAPLRVNVDHHHDNTRFGASVAEVDHHELWQRSRLTLACVAREYGEAERLLDEAERWLVGQEWELGRVERRVVTLDD